MISSAPRLQTPFLFPVLGVALLFALGAAVPYVLHTFHPSFEGLTIIRDKDFGNYYSRLERALSGFPSEADNGITPVGSGIEGGQIAGLEIALGVFLGWLGIPAPTLSVILTPLFVFLLFLLFHFLFRTLEFSPPWALGMTSLYFFLLFPVVSRVMHPGWSFVPAIAALIAFLHFWKHPSLPLALLTGLLLGMLPYIYFWSFSYVWAVAGSAVLLHYITRPLKNDLHTFTPSHSLFLVVLLVTFFVALPFFLHTWELMQHPLYLETARRAGFLFTRSVESPMRSILLALQVGLFLSLWKQERQNWRYLATLSLLLGVFLAMHQNIVHGTLLMFSSHFYPHLVLGSLVAGAYVLLHRVPLLPRVGVAGIAVLFLAGAAYDYLPGYRFFVPKEEDFQDQYLRRPIKLLRENGTRDVVLTDAHTGRVLTSFTDEGIIYTTHARHLLLSDAELAERFCLSELFLGSPPNPYRSLYIEYTPVLDSLKMRERERVLVGEACERVRSDPLPWLRKYGVTHILWNQEGKPQWSMTRYSLPLTVLEASNTWLLLSLSPAFTP